jgi:hypothetical protein
MRKISGSILAIVCLAGWPAAIAQNNPNKPDGGHGRHAQPGANVFNVAVPAHDYDLILARPEKSSVTLSALAYREMEGFLGYGTQPGVCTNQTATRQFKAGAPVEFVLNALQPDIKYFYQFHSRSGGAAQFSASPEFSFHTARPPGRSFAFTMTADVHLDEHTSAEVFEQSLANIRADRTDFHIDLGNLFMTDKHATRDEAARQYLAQRYYLGQIGSFVPLFLALGVHDGESSRYDDGSPDGLAAWSNAIRKNIFRIPCLTIFTRAIPFPKRRAVCSKIISRGDGATRCSWCWIRIAIRFGSMAARATAGLGRSGAGNTTGLPKRSRAVRRNSNSSSPTICLPATRLRAAAWKLPVSTNGAEKISMALKVSRNTGPAGPCRCINCSCAIASRRFFGRMTIFMPGRSWTGFFT